MFDHAIPLRRLLPKWGVLSRGETDLAIAARRLSANGIVLIDRDAVVDVERDTIRLDGEELRPRTKLYLKLHKPVGVVTTLRDPEGRRTVRDLIPRDRPDWQRAKPVGRLDRDSSGLLLLTTDGDFHFSITGPESTIEKVYHVEVSGRQDLETFAPLESGFVLGGERLAPMRATLIGQGERTTLLELTLTQGRFRQIRRVMLALGLRVVTLHRVRIGSIELEGLRCGEIAVFRESEMPSRRDVVT
jgi:23S rRNA pseudouridine2605 synthase